MLLLATLVFEGKYPNSLLQDHVPHRASTSRMDHIHSLQALDGFEEECRNFRRESGSQHGGTRSGIRAVFNVGFKVREVFQNAGLEVDLLSQA